MNKTLLENPSYLYCERTSCVLRCEICLKRQDANQQDGKFTKIKFFDCHQCVQGLKIREAHKILGPNYQRKPVEGYGNKVPECPFYTACLELVVGKDWASFHCDECPYNQGDFETVSLAATCPTDGLVPFDEGECPDEAIEPPESESAAVTIDFSDHVDLLNLLKEIAFDQGLSVEEVLLRSLKGQLGGFSGVEFSDRSRTDIISDGYAQLVFETKATLWNAYSKSLREDLRTRTLWTVKETALLLEKSEADIHRMVAIGQIDAVQIGKKVRIKKQVMT